MDTTPGEALSMAQAEILRNPEMKVLCLLLDDSVTGSYNMVYFSSGLGKMEAVALLEGAKHNFLRKAHD